jgi:hypothetical protein
MTKIIEWDSDGYPTEESLEQLRKAIDNKNFQKATEIFYEALKENFYSDACRLEQTEVRGEVINVWAYHTVGWSGNESIINVLKDAWLFGWLLERYDSGGHYYFKPPEKIMRIWDDQD